MPGTTRSSYQYVLVSFYLFYYHKKLQVSLKIKVELGQRLVNALMLVKTKEDRGMGVWETIPTHLYNLVGGKGLSGHMVLVEHHIDTRCGYEYGQVHFNGFSHCRFVAAVSIHFRISFLVFSVFVAVVVFCVLVV